MKRDHSLENPLRPLSSDSPPPEPYEFLQLDFSSDDNNNTRFEPSTFTDDDDDFFLPFYNPPAPPAPEIRSDVTIRPFDPEDAGDFYHPPEILSKVTIRPFDPDDAGDLAAWASDERVTRFTPWDPFTCTEQALDHIIDWIIPHPWYRSICLGNRSIGSIYFQPGSGNARCRGEIGYHLGVGYWGCDVDTLAVKIVTAEIFREFPGVERIEALVDVDNEGPQRVFERAGFMWEGILNRYVMVKGRARDMVVYSFVCDGPIERLFIFPGEMGGRV